MQHLILWLYKEPKVSVLQANAQLVQKGKCWTSLEARVQYSLGVTFCYWNFLFSRSKASDSNIGIIANFLSFEKPLMEKILLLADHDVHSQRAGWANIGHF